MRRLPPCWTRQRRRCGRSGHNVPVQPAAPLRPVPRFPAPFSVVTCNSVQICANSVSIAQGCAELHIFAFSWMAGWALLANNAGLLACGSARGGARNGTPCGAPAAQDGVLVACGWLSVPGRHGEAVRRDEGPLPRLAARDRGASGCRYTGLCGQGLFRPLAPISAVPGNRRAAPREAPQVTESISREGGRCPSPGVAQSLFAHRSGRGGI
jgi:hypothetical protein